MSQDIPPKNGGGSLKRGRSFSTTSRFSSTTHVDSTSHFHAAENSNFYFHLGKCRPKTTEPTTLTIPTRGPSELVMLAGSSGAARGPDSVRRVTLPALPSPTSPCQQLVLYKQRAMVVYDASAQRLEARVITLADEEILRNYRGALCPMCGQEVQAGQLSFQAQSYFRIVQDFFSNRFSTGFRPTGASPPQPKSPHPSAPVGAPSLQNEANPFCCPASDAESDCLPVNIPKELLVTGYYRSFFKEITALGSGTFGQVYRCSHHLDEVYLGEYAVKKIPVGDNRQWLQKMLREVKIRERLRNSNIVEYKHSWLEMYRGGIRQPTIPWLFVLMEFCNGGDLESYMGVNRHCVTSPFFEKEDLNAATPSDDGSTHSVNTVLMPESHIWKFFFDIANGLNHLHHSGVLHRDLKPQNILLHCTLDSLTGKRTATAALSDFGTSELLSERARMSNRHGFTGDFYFASTLEYTAPELLERDASGMYRQDYDEKSDLWSLGMILYFMAFGTLPYRHSVPQKLRDKILTHTDPRQFIPPNSPRSTDLTQLIEALLQRDPAARPSLDDIACHARINRRVLNADMLEAAGREIAAKLTRQAAACVDTENSPSDDGKFTLFQAFD